jgi:hypothetical protein
MSSYVGGDIHATTNLWVLSQGPWQSPPTNIQLCPALRDELLWLPAALIPRLWSPPILVHPVHHFFDHLMSRDVVRRLIDYAALVFSWRSQEIE